MREGIPTRTLKTPDITPAQLVAIVGSTVALLVAFGLDIDETTQDAIKDWVTVVASVLLVSDAGIRIGRARYAAQPPKSPTEDSVT